MTFDLRQFGFFVIGCVLAFVPVFGGGWLVSYQANQAADQYLIGQTMAAREGASQMLNEAFDRLRVVASQSSPVCSPDHIRAMQSAAIANPSIAIMAVFTLDDQLVCISPELARADLQGFGDMVPMRDGEITLSQVRLSDTRITGLEIKFTTPDHIHVAIIPRSVITGIFNQVADTTGIVLSLEDQVIFGREVDTYDGSDRAQMAVQSLPLTVGPVRVQVSIDRNWVTAQYASFHRWVTIGAMIMGILVILLVIRLIHYTPKNINEIERAIDHDEFVPFYQPTIDIATGKLVGCEVLVRWVKPDGTIVSPGAFIGIAEQTGLAVPMTRNLMRAVVRDLEKAYSGRRDLKVAINLFNHHFTNLDIIADVEEIFGPSGIAYSQVVLEITERAPLDSISQAKIIMRKLQGLGCRLALDDAGTGHGGLAYLQELGLDIVKIDKMFIDQIGKSRIGESITMTLSELAKQLDMDVVAEGVETVEQVAHLKRLGIRQAQGYLFAPALPAERYLALIKKLGAAPAKEKKVDAQMEGAMKAATLREAARQIKAVDSAA